MIRCGFTPKLWDMVELRLGEGPGLQGAVRWIRGDSIGLEFAHETQIDCNRRAALGTVAQRHPAQFPGSDSLPRRRTYEAEDQAAEEDLGARDEKRHPLIWMGEIHYAHDSNPVRLRNVSAGGALVDVAVDYPLEAEVMLDLGDAGQYFTIVQWVAGDQAGLRFVRPFDIANLAKAKPDVMPHSWNVPTFLHSNEDEDASDSPWDDNWGRSSIERARTDLEGFLKR